jgi:predicted MPP superfamily phosphohydrolase
LSDLHYAPGEVAERDLERADALIRALAPDLLLVVGDLTRAGLVEQFEPVVSWLRGFGAGRVLSIPGNRDFPASRVTVSRPTDSDLHYFLTAPDTPALEGEASGVTLAWTPFSEYFSGLDVFERRTELAVVGLNSEPVIPDESLDLALAWFGGSAPASARVFFTHRALLPTPGKKLKDGDLLPNAGDILQRLLAARVDLIVCAHLHRANVWRLGTETRETVVLSMPSLLDASGTKQTGFVSVELSRKKLQATLHALDGTSTPMAHLKRMA